MPENGYRQVSLLAKESVDRMQEHVSVKLFPGVFAENILCEGIELEALAVGTRLRIGKAVRSHAASGKECQGGLCDLKMGR